MSHGEEYIDLHCAPVAPMNAMVTGNMTVARNDS